MSKKLMMNKYNNIDWDIDKKSSTPIKISELCKEYINENGYVSITDYSNNQVLELDITKVTPNLNINEPRIQFLSKANWGQQIYWNKDRFVIANTGSYSIPFFPPCTLRLEFVNDMFYIYMNGEFLYKIASYSSTHIVINGLKVNANNNFMVTGFRYKNFEE